MNERTNFSRLMVIALSTVATLVICCMGDCPERNPVNRGMFRMKTFPFDLDNGTVEIRENDVEIKYMDNEGRDWTVRYNILDEVVLP